LPIIDDQLAAFGLEIVQYDTQDSDYMWKIEPRVIERGSGTQC